MARSIPSIDLLQCVSDVYAEPTVILAGAGVSRTFPSLLPVAGPILHDITFPATFPPGVSEPERKRLATLVPEIYYQAVNEFTDGRANQIWKFLSLGQTNPKLVRQGLGPNLYHLGLAFLAWHHRAPLITTNFDSLFEAAADQLGLSPVVCHGRYGLPRRAEEVVIWKIHGTIQDIAQLHTDLYRTSIAPKALRIALRELLTTRRLCMIGYSGRDADLLPSVLLAPMKKPIFWIDLDFPDSHVLHKIFWGTATRMPPFLAVIDPKTQFADRLVDIITRHPTGKRLEVLASDLRKRSAALPEYLKVRLGRYLVATARRNARQVMNPQFVPDDPTRMIVHGLALASVGMTAEALVWLDRYTRSTRPPPTRLCRAHIIRAYCFHTLGRYIDSEAAAREALVLAKSFRLRPEQAHARVAICAARLQQESPAVLAQFDPRRARVKAILMMANLIWTTIIARRFVPLQINERSTAAELRSRWAYLGHIARMLAQIQGIVSAICPPKQSLIPFPRRFFEGMWRRFGLIAEASRYAVGIANAKRHVERLRDGDSNELLSSMHYFALVSGNSEIASVQQDQATRLLRAGDLVGARTACDQALKSATLDGNCAMIFRILLTKQQAGSPITTKELVDAVALVQGQAYRRIEGLLRGSRRFGI